MLPTTRPLSASWRKNSTLGSARAQLADGEIGPYVGRLPILEADGGVDRDVARLAVQGRDDRLVALLDEGAADLAGPRQLLVVRVQLLVEEHELADARGGRQRRVDRVDLPLHEIVDLPLGGEIGV